ncbi:HET-domain-containing protein [Mollisia scopiformis]|uniref:HET-domain-containing protein n=1 Tax=Mollisia scopiformis TaxID=149040 RepID=A0A194XAH6_MOLSC|nr:HET-domain-containing protein [Mollisia scopiformis]KUJ16762.1 HET-domain-containing protein [Mollisia scopiformis]
MVWTLYVRYARKYHWMSLIPHKAFVTTKSAHFRTRLKILMVTLCKNLYSILAQNYNYQIPTLEGFDPSPEWDGKQLRLFLEPNGILQKLAQGTNDLMRSIVVRLGTVDDCALDGYTRKPEYLIFLRICTFNDDPASKFFGHRQPWKSASSDVAFALIKEWLRDCDSNHTLCKTPARDFFPRRLIDVGPIDGSAEPFLIELDNGALASSPNRASESALEYFALSYCWGSSQQLVTTPSNIARYKTSLPLSQFPATIKDAVTVTRQLGVRYLWVDALCILQGSSLEAQQDWRRESSRMSSIYGSASLVIAAASASDVSQGFLADRRSYDAHTAPLKLPFKSSILPDDSGSFFIHPFLEEPAGFGYWSPFPNDPLSRRGWALQERLLSTRLLTYKADDITWECQTCRRREKVAEQVDYCKAPNGSDERFWRLSKIRAITSLEWCDIVRDYSSRSITVASDKLPAVSGLARLCSKTTSDEYVAGLWKSDLLASLLWYTITWSGSQFSASSVYRAPSWSWASLDAEVNMRPTRKPAANKVKLSDQTSKGDLTEILECVAVPSGESEFGGIKDGWILARGPLRQVRLSLTPASDHGRPYSEFSLTDMATKEWAKDPKIDLMHKESASSSNVSELSKDLWCLALTNLHDDEGERGLLLTHARDGSSDYKRVGVFTNRRRHGDDLNFKVGQWERQTIKII